MVDTDTDPSEDFTCFSSRDVVTSTCTKNSQDSKNVAFNFQMRS